MMKIFKDQVCNIGIRISTVVERKERNILYVGDLVDYTFAKDGSIKNVIISHASRRDFEKENDDEIKDEHPYLSDSFYKISGKYLIVEISSAKTLNVVHAGAQKVDKPLTLLFNLLNKQVNRFSAG